MTAGTRFVTGMAAVEDGVVEGVLPVHRAVAGYFQAKTGCS
jgi:hypothetical protein